MDAFCDRTLDPFEFGTSAKFPAAYKGKRPTPSAGRKPRDNAKERAAVRTRARKGVERYAQRQNKPNAAAVERAAARTRAKERVKRHATRYRTKVAEEREAAKQRIAAIVKSATWTLRRQMHQDRTFRMLQCVNAFMPNFVADGNVIITVWRESPVKLKVTTDILHNGIFQATNTVTGHCTLHKVILDSKANFTLFDRFAKPLKDSGYLAYTNHEHHTYRDSRGSTYKYIVLNMPMANSLGDRPLPVQTRAKCLRAMLGCASILEQHGGALCIDFKCANLVQFADGSVQCIDVLESLCMPGATGYLRTMPIHYYHDQKHILKYPKYPPATVPLMLFSIAYTVLEMLYNPADCKYHMVGYSALNCKIPAAAGFCPAEKKLLNDYFFHHVSEKPRFVFLGTAADGALVQPCADLLDNADSAPFFRHRYRTFHDMEEAEHTREKREGKKILKSFIRGAIE